MDRARPAAAHRIGWVASEVAGGSPPFRQQSGEPLATRASAATPVHGRALSGAATAQAFSLPPDMGKVETVTEPGAGNKAASSSLTDCRRSDKRPRACSRHCFRFDLGALYFLSSKKIIFEQPHGWMVSEQGAAVRLDIQPACVGIESHLNWVALLTEVCDDPERSLVDIQLQ